MIDGRPTLTTHHDNLEAIEVLTFECPHQTTKTGYGLGSADTPAKALRAVTTRSECACVPEVFEDTYPSLNWRIRALSYDMEQINTRSDKQTHGLLMAPLFGLISGLESLDCACGPGLRTVTSSARSQSFVSHVPGCPMPSQREDPFE